MTLSKDELRLRYIDQQLGSVEIGRQLGCTPQCVMYWLHKYGIPMRNASESSSIAGMRAVESGKRLKYPMNRAYLEEHYVRGRKTPNQIARQIGCSWDVVIRRLHRYGFQVRNHDTKGVRDKRTVTESRKFQKILLRAYRFSCAICGYDKFVNCCHILPRSKGGTDTLNNGIVLCPNHHTELDYGIITPDEVRKYQVNKT